MFHRKFIQLHKLRLPWTARWGLCYFFGVIVTLAILQYSFRHGRLITVPTYDDIGYFADGADRLQTIHFAGFPGLWESYMARPPHSPLQSLMATSAFALFGLHEWAPYALNGLLALGYFFLADWLLRGVGPFARFLCYIVLASMPFVTMAVHEFRPDHAAALFTTVGLMLLLSRPFVYGTRRRRIWAGVWLGIAMLGKPPVFPQTLALGFAAMVLATLSDWLTTGRRPRLIAAAQAWAAVIAPMLLIPAPHYYHDRQHLFSYIHDILFGTFRHVYEYRGTASEHLLYFLTGTGGRAMLGPFVWILPALLLAGIASLAAAGARRDLVRAAAMLLVVLAAWIIPTVNQTKSAYFGLAFDTLAGFTVLFVVGRVLARERIAGWISKTPVPFAPATTVCLLVALIAMWNFQWPTRNGNAGAGWEIQRRQIVQGIFDTIVAHCDFHHLDEAPLPDPAIASEQRVHSSNPAVLFCSEGDFNPDMLHFMAIQRQVPLRAMFNSASGNPADFLYYFGRADFLFCSEPGTLLIADFLPFAPIQQQLLDEARSRSEFEEIGKWTFMKSTHSMYLFRRKDFTGFVPINGLSQEIGPVAGYDHNTVHWGIGPSTTLRITAETDGAYEVYWRALTDVPDQIVTVKRDGQIIGTQPVQQSERDFGESRFPIAFTAGQHELEFAYSHWHGDKPEQQAVVFLHLNIARKKN